MTASALATQKTDIDIPSEIASALNLSNDVSSEHAKVDRDRFFDLLRNFTAMVRAGFPILPERQWHLILTAIQEPHEQILGAMGTALAYLPASYITWQLQEGHEFGFDESDIEEVSKFGAAETVAAYLVADRFWHSNEGDITSLRKVLSEVSGRPEECVLKGDPDSLELWEVSKVAILSDHSVRAHFDYCEQPMAKLDASLSADKSELTLRTFECFSSRPLIEPEYSLRSALFQMALKQMFEAIDQS
ncbi:hypothetical protein [Thioclava nitratireducens]|uniref:hypothetical protein n=1 Tax=Thioclava nitratireducens TaxID=1915078 RepID=UPI0024818141|nr:hypothetical protein [Thioclava nitratireducens]WGT51450.1 hypothetical protein P0N61_05320 [Thioclava nitratireducens]